MLGGYSSTWVLHFALWGYFMLEVLVTTSDVCRTKVCVEEAKKIKKNMDPFVEPCDDFYHFACGKYLKPKGDDVENRISSFVTRDNNLKKQIDRLLVNLPKDPNEPKPFKMTRNLYKICLRQDLVDKRGIGFLLDMIKGVGGWPVLEGDKWDADKFDWVETVYKMDDIGLRAELFDLAVTLSLVDSFKRLIVIDQALFTLPIDYLIHGRKNQWVLAYRSYMVDIARHFGAKHDAAVKELGDVLDFEVELAKIAMSPKERRDMRKLYNPLLLKDLQSIHPIVNWDQYIRKLMSNITMLGPNEVINVKAPTYFVKLQELLKVTDKRILANYLIWKGLSSTVSILTSEMRDSKFNYEKTLTGRDEREPRWKECLMVTVGSMYLAVGSMYVRTYFKEEAKAEAVEMVENIHAEMMNILNSADWMDEETRSYALDKCMDMHLHIGYPSELLDDKKLEEFYEKLEITGEQYFEAMVNLTKFGWNYNFGLLRQPVNKTDWRTHGSAALIDAFYNPVENALSIPAAILHDVFFSLDRPKYMNYGAIGSVIGNEITRGFDDLGQQFNKLGNMVCWSKEKTKNEFMRRSQCFISQANEYTVKSIKMKVNGVNTQSQNVADTGGLKLSYKAYNSWAENHEKEPRLVGLEQYTPQQMFWLSAANIWCTVYEDDALKMHLYRGGHPPAEYRVNGAMSNQEAFARDFNCPVGSKMNPSRRCNVW